MNRFRILLAAAAGLALAAFTGPDKKFSVDFPAGWAAPTYENGIAESEGTSGGAYCRAEAVALDALKKYKQDELNAQYAAPLDAKTWSGILNIVPEKFQVSNAKVMIFDGHVAHIATITFDKDVMGEPMTALFAAHILPGRMVNVGCFAQTAAYTGLKPTFAKTVASLKPL